MQAANLLISSQRGASKMIKYFLSAIVLATSSLGLAQDPTVSGSPTLYQDLRFGMTANEVASILQQMSGVKSVKIKRVKVSKPQDFLDIDHSKEGLAIQNGRYELKPEFENGRLSKVLLVGDSMCANIAMSEYSGIVDALKSKYPVVPDDQKELTEFKVLTLLSDAYTSQQNESYVAFFSNDETVVVTVFAFSKEAPPRYAGGGSFAYNLWKLANSLYDGRVRECSGTGDARLRIAFQYHSKSEFQKLLKQTEATMNATAEETKSKL
jgi:hypothetical protein